MSSMFTEYLTGLMESVRPYLEGMDTTVACGVVAMVVLVALWIFARILRTLAVVLLAFCVVFLVLKVGFGIDLLQCICSVRG